MPVILRPVDYDRWLDPDVNPESMEELLVPYPSELIETFEVSNLANNARCDTPDCIHALDKSSAQ